MRSSIACVRCRRSKVKCVNSGVGTPCRSCEAGGRECTYPVPVSSGRRRESVVGQAVPRLEGLVDDQVKKPRQQRKSNVGLPGQPIPIVTEGEDTPVDALDPNLLTSIVWQELFDIFQLHFSTDLPFIHPPTFLKPLRQANTLGPQYKPASNDQISAVQPPASTEFLLGFLALTARFHPKIVEHHSPSTNNRPSKPLVASEFYASAASARIKTITGEKLGVYDLETTQSILMLALHDWGMNRGAQAWAYLGMATRSAQAMGLQYERDLDDSPFSRSMPLHLDEKMAVPDPGRSSFHAGGTNDAFVQAEIRRRTFWTCFILDRYLSNGKFRPQTINAKDIRIQLPASEQAFLFGEKVRTLMLGEDPVNASPRPNAQNQRRTSLIGEALNGGMKRHSFSLQSNGSNGKMEDAQNKWEVGAEEGLVSRYIKILDIYAKIVKWACGGGRRRDTLPPWSPQSQWFTLRRALEDFRTSLPRQQVLTPQNTSAHINIRTSTPYTLVHITASLCHVLLYREFLPFIPLRHGKPQGPLDGTSRPILGEPTAPPGFWEEGARECFGAARDVIDLSRTCQEWGVAVETPVVGFAVYNVALLGIYLINFPWMDVNGFLRRTNSTREDHIPHGAEAARKALEVIGPLRPRLHMAEGWNSTLKRAHQYFSRLRTAWVDSVPRMMQGREREIWNDQSIATAQLHPHDAESTRVLLERVLRDLDGGDQEGDVEMSDVQVNGSSAGSDMTSPRVKQETPSSHQTNESQHAQQEERWNAINSVAAAAMALTSVATGGHATTTTAGGPVQAQGNSAHFRFYTSYSGPGSSSSAATPPSHGQDSFRTGLADSASSSGGHAHGKSPNPQTPRTAPAAPSWTSTNRGSGSGDVEREGLHGGHGFTSPLQHRRASEAAASGAGSFATPGQAYTAAILQQRRASEKEIRDPELWLMGLEKGFGGDDLAAFVDGVEVDEAARGLVRAGRGGWLGAVWGVV